MYKKKLLEGDYQEIPLILPTSVVRQILQGDSLNDADMESIYLSIQHIIGWRYALPEPLPAGTIYRWTPSSNYGDGHTYKIVDVEGANALVLCMQEESGRSTSANSPYFTMSVEYLQRVLAQGQIELIKTRAIIND